MSGNQGLMEISMAVLSSGYNVEGDLQTHSRLQCLFHVPHVQP